MAHVSTLFLLRDVPLTPGMADVIIFPSISAQTQYFQSKVAFSFTDLMYVRDGVVTIPNQAGNYRTCTYCMWQNPDFPGKWFYGFVTSVSYVADGTTMVMFSEDFFQTWYFDMAVRPCFVEREHVNDDSIGVNLKEETVALGPYVTQYQASKYMTDWAVIVSSAVSFAYATQVSQCGVIQGSMTGLSYYGFTLDTAGMTYLQNRLEDVANLGQSDGVTDMWIVPAFMLDEEVLNSSIPITDAHIKNIPFDISIPRPSSLDGYVPRNKKLLSYPYVGLQVSNRGGQDFGLRFEFFDGDCKFQYKGTPMPGGRVMLRPVNYDGVPVNANYTVSIGNYPHGSWIKDNYSNWLATQQINWDYQLEQYDKQTARKISETRRHGFGNIGSQAFKGGMAGYSSGVPGAVIGAAAGVLNASLENINDINELKIQSGYAREDIEAEMDRQNEVAQMTPPSSRGNVGADVTQQAYHEVGFSFYGRSITAEYAKSIDSYFDMFGYRVDQVKYPNFFGRLSWNYVKTIGAVVQGNAPLYAKVGFERLLNQGVRLWHTYDVGNYSLDNSITGG